jgi:hypothetical protein
MLLWLSAAGVFLLGAFPYYSGALWSATDEVPPAAAGKQGDGRALVVFTVGGMTCAGCAEGIRATLESEPGVTAAVGPGDDVRAKRFLGSPTIRVDGVDVHGPEADEKGYGFGCRIYVHNGVSAGWPWVEKVREALARARG